jgi:exonuclease VII small subunit
MPKHTVHVAVPLDVQLRAWENGINLSGICRKAITEAVEKLEQPKETRSTPSTAENRAVASVKEDT